MGQSGSARTPVSVLFAVGWLGLFAVVFFGLDLPNSSPPLNRSVIWLELPDVLWNNVVAHPDADPAGWRFFPQRLPMIFTAAWIMAGVWGLGTVLLRTLRLRESLSSVERIVVGYGLGLSAMSLLVLGCGLAGLLKTSTLAALTSLAAALGLILDGMSFIQQRKRHAEIAVPQTSAGTKRQVRWWDLALRGQIPFPMLRRGLAVFVVALFVLAMWLGALLPSIDFDVKEYHLQGPKEWYTAGSIFFLPHNVYTSFPFLTEMFLLQGMVLHGDWFAGALAGQLVLGTFGLLTGLVVFAAVSRWFGSTAAWIAAVIHLTTPWTYRISVIAYAEGGATLYLFLTAFAVALWIERGQRRNDLLLTGLFAGSSMACKYPGMLSVVIPCAALVAWLSLRAGPSSQDNATAQIAPNKTDAWRAIVTNVVILAGGTVIAVGPWLLKNLFETGNPVYPLLNSVFHGIDWTPTLEANWKRAHGPPHHQPADILVKLFDVSFKSDWLSPLLFSLAPFSLWLLKRRVATDDTGDGLGAAAVSAEAVRFRRWLIVGAWVYVTYLFGSWWLLTHRIDRFWIPMIPLVSALAGIGAAWSANQLWRNAAGGWISACVLFNLGFITLPNCGLNAYLSDITALTKGVQATAPGIAWLNEHLPPGSKVLMVGEAQVFDARFPLVYNTVFDVSIFEKWCSAQLPNTEPGQQPLRTIAEIRQKLADEGITHIFVNWGEIFRYRESGYGYTDFVTAKRFEQLQRAGVLNSEAFAVTGLRAKDSFRPDQIQQITDWSTDLFVRTEQGDAFLTTQLFTVRGAKP